MLLSTCKVLAIPMADSDTLELDNIREAAKYFKVSQNVIRDCIEDGDSIITDVGEFFFDYDGTSSTRGKAFEYIIIEEGTKRIFKSVNELAEWCGSTYYHIFNKVVLREPILNKTTGKSYIVEKIEIEKPSKKSKAS